jgi:hypothetical protein
MATRPYRHILEDEQQGVEQQSSQQQLPSKNAQKEAGVKINLATQIATLTAAIDKKEKEFNDFKAAQINKINLLRKKAAEMGVDLSGNASESKTYRFSKKLYEAMNTNKADELAAAIKVTFDRLDTLSFYLDDRGCATFGRRLLAWINEQGWNDGLDHWEEVEEKIRLLFTNGSISMSRREITEFVEQFKEILMNNTVFSWIFGNKNNRISKFR